MKKQLFVLGIGLLALIAAPGCTTLEDQAQEGDTQAQWMLADCLMTGRTLEGESYGRTNAKEAKAWLEKAVEADDKNAIALKGEYMAAGRYGNTPDIEKCLAMMEPAIIQGDCRRVAYGFLKINIENQNYNHLDACAKALNTIYDVTGAAPQCPYVTYQASVLLHKNLATFMDGVYKSAENPQESLEVQRQRILEAKNFVLNGHRGTQDWRRSGPKEIERAWKRFGEVERGRVEKVWDKLTRTVEVDGFGATPKDCVNDAKRNALEALCGIKIEGAQKMSNSETVKNDQVDQNSDYEQKLSSQISGNLQSFVEISAPKLADDGTFVGRYRAVAKEKAKPAKAPKKKK